MALQGTLETFSVPEVLRLLAGTRKTGMLALDGDRGAGQVWLHEGRIVGARSAHEPEGDVESVLFDLLRYVEGSFVFESDAEYPGDAPADSDVESALGAAEQLLEEWHEIAAVVPSLRVWVSMLPTIPTSSITVTAEQWASLAIVGRGTSGHRLADELGLGELDGSRRIRDLRVAGLVDVDDAPVSVADVLADDGLADDGLADDLGDAGVWTTADDLTVGLAGFVARVADDERNERAETFGVTTLELLDEPADDVAGPAIELDLVEEPSEVPAADAEPADAEPADTEPDDDAWSETDERPEPELTGSDVVAPDELSIADGPADDAVASDDGDADEFLSQLANLSPKAAAAIEATASAEETPTRRLPNGDADEEINRNLLLKFLSSAKP